MLYGNVPTPASRISPGARWTITVARVALIAAILSTGGIFAPASAQVPQRWSVTIDASTTQPVGTGFWAPASTGDVIVFAEGALRGPTQPERFERGWFGPAGQDHYDGTGQPIVDGMPYGALVGGFTPDLASFQFLGRMGSFSLQPGHLGHELRLALNLSDADLATLGGRITVTVIYLPNGTASASKFVITRNTPLPLATGLIAAAGEQYVVLPRGGMEDPALANSAYSDGWFGPEGLLGLVSPTQPHPGGPYGALYGGFGAPGNDFYIGDGGCWSTQISDQGVELTLLLNADAAAQAGMNGKLVVYVVRVPPPNPAGLAPAGDSPGLHTSSYPNPMRDHSTIRLRLDREDRVRLRVFDAQGRMQRVLADQTLPAGAHEFTWDGADGVGRRLPAGAYFYQCSTGDGTETGRLVVVE